MKLFKSQTFIFKHIAIVAMVIFPCVFCNANTKTFPDGTQIADWFSQNKKVDIETLGKQYKLTDYGIFPSGRVHTKEIQELIDKAAEKGGGVIVVPQGVFLTGGLHFKQGTHLYLEEGATLMGSDFIGDYPFGKTRCEGETCKYFGALINATGLDGFTISGKGTIDGNGLKYHQQFWMRRTWNPQCTNKDEQRPRLLFIQNCKNIQIEDVKLQNAAFWTTHIFSCEKVKILGVKLFSMTSPKNSKGPSTDGIDLDVVKDVLIKNCYMSINDDAIAIKGGRGPYADFFETKYEGVEIPAEHEGNGINQNIIIENCEFGHSIACLTIGSESVHTRNVIMRHIKVSGKPAHVFRMKMRPDTPQRYEYISVEDVVGNALNFFTIAHWTQFFDLKGRKDSPKSYADHITISDCNIDCTKFLNFIQREENYHLSNFTFENIKAKVRNPYFNPEFVENFKHKNLQISQETSSPKTVIHFSFDDIIYSLQDLTKNENRYESIFDCPFFAFLKQLHDDAGAVFSLYCFSERTIANPDNKNQKEVWSLSQVTSKFSKDFKNNSHWLRFGLHLNPEGKKNYASTSAETARNDYESFVKEILRITGSKNCIDRCVRLHNFAGNRESIKAMKNCRYGIQKLLGADDTRNSYYLDSLQSAQLYQEGAYTDNNLGIQFYRTERRLEKNDPLTVFTSPNIEKTERLEFFTHEDLVFKNSELQTESLVYKRMVKFYDYVKNNKYKCNF